MKILNRKEVRQKIHRRIRKKVSGTADRPRLAVHYSNKNIYAQIIDDVVGRTLCAACSLDKEVELKGSNVATAERLARCWPRGRAISRSPRSSSTAGVTSTMARSKRSRMRRAEAA